MLMSIFHVMEDSTFIHTVPIYEWGGWGRKGNASLKDTELSRKSWEMTKLESQ